MRAKAKGEYPLWFADDEKGVTPFFLVFLGGHDGEGKGVKA